MSREKIKKELAAGWAALARRLGYPGDDLGRLPLALTHKSWANEAARPQGHNERLEFLGDAVLGLVVGGALMRAHPSASEGTLSRLRASLVNERSLAEVARRLELGALLRVGRGEDRSGGRDKDSLLSDAYEAMLGALYLDLGLERVEVAVLDHMGDSIARSEPRAADLDYKTRIQELVQAEFQTTPAYRLLSTEGPEHAKIFEVALMVMGLPLARGRGRSKKQAERAAAREAFRALEP